jgi:hypothetical protein
MKHPVKLIADVAVQLSAYQTLFRRKHVMPFRIAGTGCIEKSISSHVIVCFKEIYRIKVSKNNGKTYCFGRISGFGTGKPPESLYIKRLCPIHINRKGVSLQPAVKQLKTSDSANRRRHCTGEARTFNFSFLISFLFFFLLLPIFGRNRLSGYNGQSSHAHKSKLIAQATESVDIRQNRPYPDRPAYKPNYSGRRRLCITGFIC